MIGKLIVFAIDWEGAVRKAERALCEYVIEGIPTNLTLHRQIVKAEDFRNATFNTGYLPEKLDRFDLQETDSKKSEDEKHEQLVALMASIKKNQIQVRQ
jgi:pyruvate carboxylase subunit A